MKIHKKDKQQMFTGLLKHTPPPSSAADSSSASDQNNNAQTSVPTIPRGHLVVGPKDQLCLITPVGSSLMSNHCSASGTHTSKHLLGGPRPPSSFSEEDDGGGGGRVKKKRKKKDKRECTIGGGEVGTDRESIRPKKRREEDVKEETVVTLRKSKVLKEGRERKERRTKGREDSRETPKEVKNVISRKSAASSLTSGQVQVPIRVPGKRGRKPKVKILPPVPSIQAAPTPSLRLPTKSHGQLQSNQNLNANHVPANSKSLVPSAPKQRGRKPRDPGVMPVEKKKKAKRRNQEPMSQEAAENDDTTSMSTVTMGEDSQDALDNSKRRSVRQVKRRKYNEDLDFKVVDDDGETIAVLGAGRIAALNATALAWQAEEPPEDEANIIEKILSVRTLKKETPSLTEDQDEESEEFYVKYRNFSYLHCKWATLEELEKDPRIHQKIKRFRTKQAQMKHLFTEPDEDLFNPDYVEVDRVLEVAVTTDTETGEEVTHYLVKWCSLSYEEATWELQEDLDPEKIKEFEEIQKMPPELRHVERPPPENWQKLEKSRDYRNGNQLREYQLEGMNWLLFNWYNRKNCILADEMGLGKTIQSITFLFEIFSKGIRGPFLIIAPLSTITNWEREFRTWTRMNVIVYHGSQISRQMILQYEMFHKDAQGNSTPGVLKFHGLITTFEMIMADCPELRKLHWRCVVIDEAHRLKNRNCKLLEGLKLMNLEHKVLLTGTPLQNSVEELFSLLNFLEPLQFPSESTFLEEFGDLKTEEQVKKLQAILKPMMLRRLKDDVEKNLAPKEETIIEVELTNIQKKYYRAILEKNFSFLSKGANQHNMPNLINTMMELRKCCNHPYLITGAEEKILENFRRSHSPDAADFQLQAMIQAAGKLVLIDKLLPKLLAGGHKVLVFSQMVRCLDILEDYLIQRRYTYERIDGRVRGNLRQAAIDRFCKPDSDRFVFLLCTRAGGLGINLTAADTCIIFDSDWNPQNDLQAQARCHRIGQSKAVKVYRLITRNSYEREMFDKASLKLGLDKAVLQDINRKGSLNGVQQLSKLEVEDLLKKGAYGALMDEEDEGSKFCEEDIDQILQRRTQTITIQTEGKGSTFAKASFVSSGNRTDISLDDPNFWQKWAKIAEVEIDSKSEKESLVIDTPRVRKQTRHYNSFEDDELMEFSELDSDSEERPSRTRRLGERSRRYLRAECFRVEKNLLIFGWGRWKDILNHGRFKWNLSERDMEAICRALLVYCLKHYKGDDKIKSFMWDLITPSKEGEDQSLVNHSGLSAPVPRGRKGKKLKNQLNVPELKNADWLVQCNPEVILQDDSYKKHLKQHCNKVLLRVRMLYYLKVEVLGEAANQSLDGIPASKLEVALPDIDYIEIPATWWDADADKSLLIGVHKHGYERYNAMRADPDLCFLERVGMPDVTALCVESGSGETAVEPTDSVCKSEEVKDDSKADGAEERDENGKEEETCCSTDTSEKPDSTGSDLQISADLCGSDATLVTTTALIGTGTGVAALQVIQARPLWPTGPALTARVRRLITAYQRFTLRREPMFRHDFLLHDSLVAMGMGGAVHHAAGPLTWQLSEELRRCSVVPTEPDPLFQEWQRRWTRREQSDFYRAVSSFGVVYDPERKTFDWSQFRALARLERKTDESLERYFNSFVNMCRTACKLPPRKEEGLVDPGVLVEPLTEERAARTLYRIELLRKIREQVLHHPLLSARLQLCRPSLYLPVWWESGKHDRDLLIGAARHGLTRTDFYILNDPQLSFLEAHRNYVRGHPAHLHLHGALGGQPGISSSSQLPHCCLYDSAIGSHSPHPPEYPQQSSQPASASHLPPPSLDDAASPNLAMMSGSRADFLDESLELGSLQHDTDTLHGGKASKDTLNGFPFNSATGGQSMLNSYGVSSADLNSKLRSDVLVGEQGSSEETGLMAPSVELDRLQASWDGADHSSPAHHMFNESDPILGPSGLETGFLEEEDEDAQRGGAGEEEGGTLEECLGLPPSSPPSHPSAVDSVEPLSSSYMLFKDIGVNEDPSTDQTDLSASPPPSYVAPPPLSLPDINSHEPQDSLDHSEVTENLTVPVEGEIEEPVSGFNEEEEGVLAKGSIQEVVEKQREEMRNGEDPAPDQVPRQCLRNSTLPMEVPEADEIAMAAEFEESNDQLCPELKKNLRNEGELKEELSEHMLPYLGELEQENSLMCPETIEEPEEEVSRLILYQQEETMENSLDSGSLIGNTPGEILEERTISDVSAVDKAQNVGERGDVLEEKTLDNGVEMHLDNSSTECNPTLSSSTSVTSPLDLVKSCDNTNDGSEHSLSQQNQVVDFHLAEEAGDFKNVIIETKPDDLKFSLMDNRDVKLLIKEEEVKTECDPEESSIVKPDPSLTDCVKSEELATNFKCSDDQGSSHKPDDIKLHMKLETADTRELKPEVKPEDLQLAMFSDQLKTEAKPDIKTEVKPEQNNHEVKPEEKPEDLKITTSADIKAETKPELLEGDRTILTPKLEQAVDIVMKEEQVKEERPATPVCAADGYLDSPRLANPISSCEIPDSLHDTREPTIAQLLQEKALYSYSEWPKDRVIINRLDSICHTILKGKWPSSNEQYDCPSTMAANSCLTQQHHRAGFIPSSVSAPLPGQTRVHQASLGLGFTLPPPLARLPKYSPRGSSYGRGAWRLNSLPLLQERLVAPPFLPEVKRVGGRRFDYEAAAKALSGKSSTHTPSASSTDKLPVVAPPSHPTGAMLINGWQEAAIDLTKSSGDVSITAGSSEAVVAPAVPGSSSHKLPPPPITAPLTSSLGIDMTGILQAGLIHPVTGQIVNGSLRGDDALRRKRGRRRNVDALYSEFTKSRGLQLSETQGRVEVISHSSVSSSTSSPSPSPSDRPAGTTTPSSSTTPTPTQTPPQPEIIAIDREAASKGLMEWLRQNPGYSMDLPNFSHVGTSVLHGFVERPKQRRHRCKDPTKLDVNSLSGEERVPVVHRGTGRRLGGAMAPAIKELSRWLDANSEYFVAPDWADVVKHSGFLPEGKFSRILTEPVNKDPGSRRRGRRPRNEMPKPLLSASDSSSGLGPPLFMNGGLIGSMDSMVAMQNLRSGLPGFPISGIMAAGFTHGFPVAAGSAEDAKNGLSMLPMMLHSVPHAHGTAIPQHALFSVGAMMAPPPQHPSSSSSSSASVAKVTTTTAPSSSASAEPATSSNKDGTTSSGEKEVKQEESAAADSSKGPAAADTAAIITSTSRGHLAPAHLGATSTGHLTFNPFLIPGLSHGLLYPHMFLPHGGIMTLPAMPPGSVDGSAGSLKRRRKREQDEEEEKPAAAAAAGGEGDKTDDGECTVEVAPSSSSPPLPSTSAPADQPQDLDSLQHPDGAAEKESSGREGEEQANKVEG
ncbi:chromodomain-helicase-DNA-binding protein 6-like isoform X1 [Synchiropus splendidus]|uniref:chromodomain-helicase-DNA-binding protein 6-like isoform X1 n=1 Tax=Synchiropus splendidus TaxID=270530 RepID=UPI00237DE646|nr:chromodomain-helicase-DNA-binding protein 6-like isoform X1 [Synchiropus splendidus]